MSALVENLFGTPSTGPSPAEIQAKEEREARRRLQASRAGAQRERSRFGVSGLTTSPTSTGLSIPGTGSS